jgi:type II secretory pathway pseudopilin PulG
MRRYSNRKGQIWVETVIYTLIGLAVIGLVLAGALPKIQEKKDGLAIERSIEALRNIDDKIYSALSASGSRRVVNLEVKSGSFVIDANRETISWIMDSSFEYSEEGKTVPIGKLDVTTTRKGDYEVVLQFKYEGFDLRFNEENVVKEFNPAPTPYVIAIDNGGEEDGRIVIEFSEA